MNSRYTEKADYIRYEDDDDIVVVKPAKWVVLVGEKDSDEVYSAGEFKTREEAKKKMMEEIKEKEMEENEIDELEEYYENNDDFEEIDDGEDDNKE